MERCQRQLWNPKNNTASKTENFYTVKYSCRGKCFFKKEKERIPHEEEMQLHRSHY